MIGSFLNVVIYRLPRNMDMVFSSSHCPHCKNKIPFYLNIPVLGYFLIKGKCRSCNEKISPIYPFVEILTGLTLLFLMPTMFGPNDILNLIFLFTTFGSFICIFFIDLEFKIIPNSLNLYLLALFLVFGFLYRPYQFWLIGGATGFLFPLFVTWFYHLVRGQEGLGMGDIKLYGVLGVYLGPLGIVQNIFLSCFLGALIGGSVLLLKKMDSKTPIPFGPFIIIIATLQIFFPTFFKNYLTLF